MCRGSSSGAKFTDDIIVDRPVVERAEDKFTEKLATVPQSYQANFFPDPKTMTRRGSVEWKALRELCRMIWEVKSIVSKKCILYNTVNRLTKGRKVVSVASSFGIRATYRRFTPPLPPSSNHRQRRKLRTAAAHVNHALFLQCSNSIIISIIMAANNVNMDAVEALHVALQQSFSPDAGVRDPAEAAIKNLKYMSGATQMLLHITEEKQVRC